MQIAPAPEWLSSWQGVVVQFIAFVAGLYALWRFLVHKPLSRCTTDLETFKKEEYGKFKEEFKKGDYKLRTMIDELRGNQMRSDQEIALMREALKRIEENTTDSKKDTKSMREDVHDIDTRLARVEEKVDNIKDKME